MKLSKVLETSVEEYKKIKANGYTLNEMYKSSVAKNDYNSILTSLEMIEKNNSKQTKQKKDFFKLRKEITDSLLKHFRDVNNGVFGYSKREFNQHQNIRQAVESYLKMTGRIHYEIMYFDPDTSDVKLFDSKIQNIFQETFLHTLNVMMPLNVEQLRTKSA